MIKNPPANAGNTGLISGLDFPGGPVVKNLPPNAGNMGSIPTLGRFHVPQRN